MAEIRGIDQFLRSINGLSDELESSVKDAVRIMALQIETDAKFLAPVLTGHLMRSINTSFSEGGLSATVGTNVEYALIQEFGSSRITAKPFLIPAFTQNKSRFQENIIAAMRGMNI